jgi:MoaA/NifB/PqqE/SkfB family radical SAM enzyme
VPEQLVGYVTAVAASRPILCGGCIAYDSNSHRVLVAYEPGAFPESGTDGAPAARAKIPQRAVAEALAGRDRAPITVLGPAKPDAAPAGAVVREDSYAFLRLPAALRNANLLNMLRRGERECVVSREAWGAEHADLVNALCAARALDAGTTFIVSGIGRYLAANSDAVLFAARSREDARLLAVTVGDFTALTTAFYMFAFRQPHCPPGVSDILLHALALEAEKRGHQYLNLGLNINRGIAAFKRKWGATTLLPYVETAWRPDAAARPKKNSAPATPATPATEVAGTAGPLAVYTAPGLGSRLRRTFFGKERPFDCLQIEVTSHCPGKCGYCPHTTKQDVWISRHMDVATFAALHDLASRSKRVHLQGWGEPLTHPRFFDFAAAARRVGCAVSTTTCGLAVTDGAAEQLVFGGIDIVAFSFTGVDAAGNAARAGVAFDRAVAGIDALNRAKRKAGSRLPHIHLSYLMLASQAEAVAKLSEHMARLDVPVAVVSTLDYIAAPGMETEAYAPDERDKVEHARRILHEVAAKAARAGRVIHYALPEAHPREDCHERIRSCMYIDAAGVIAPCIYLNLPISANDPRRRAFGSVHEKKALDIWNDPEYTLFRNRLASGNPDLPCVSCPKRF